MSAPWNKPSLFVRINIHYIGDKFGIRIDHICIHDTFRACAPHFISLEKHKCILRSANGANMITHICTPIFPTMRSFP